VGVRPRTTTQAHRQTDRQTDTQTRVTTIHFASSTTHAKCNNKLECGPTPNVTASLPNTGGVALRWKGFSETPIISQKNNMTSIRDEYYAEIRERIHRLQSSFYNVKLHILKLTFRTITFI